MPHRLYFLAGMADDLLMPGRRNGLTLIERAALEAVRESEAIHAEWLGILMKASKIFGLLARGDREAFLSGLLS
jgi:hypothetical protein